jgi:hypothetical protein
MRRMDRDISFGIFTKRDKTESEVKFTICLGGEKGRKTCIGVIDIGVIEESFGRFT